MTNVVGEIAVQGDESTSLLAGGLYHRTVASRRVAIPVWKMIITCRLQEVKRLDIFSEFALRCIDAEIDSVESITEFLSLPESVVVEVLAELLSSRYISLLSDHPRSVQAFELTPDGSRVLSELVEVRPIQEDIVFHLDTLSEDLRQYEKSQLLSPTQVDADSLVVLPTVPAKEPNLRSSDNVRLAAAYSAGDKRSKKTFLGLVNHAKRPEKLFMEGRLDVFRTTDPDRPLDIEIRVDGRSAPGLTIAFLEKDYLRSMRLAAVFSEDAESLRHFLFGSESWIIDESDQMLQLAEEAVQLSEDLARMLAETEAGGRRNDPADSTGDHLEQIDGVGATLAQIQDGLAAATCRRTTLSEHELWIDRAFESSTHAVRMALSYIDDAFWAVKILPLVRSASESGIRIDLHIRGEARSRDIYVVPEFLRAAAEEIPNLAIHSLMRDVPEFIAVDDVWCVATMEKLGCSVGTFGRRLVDGRGIIIREPAAVNRLCESLTEVSDA